MRSGGFPAPDPTTARARSPRLGGSRFEVPVRPARAAFAAAFAAALLFLPATAQEPTSGVARTSEFSSNLMEGVDRGLGWLHAQMGPNGMNSPGMAAQNDYRIATTSLAGLAFLSSGSTYEEGPYATSVRNATRFLVGEADRVTWPSPTGGLVEGYFITAEAQNREQPGRMHSHGYATMFLAEVFGTIRRGVDEGDTFRQQVHDVLEGAVRLTVASQTPRHGWGYYHVGDGQLALMDEGSVTVTQVEALRAARDAGIDVPAGVIRNALDYLRTSALRMGSGTPEDPRRAGFMYSISMGERRHSYELTAAAVSTLNAAGVYDPTDELLQLGLEYLRFEQFGPGHGSRNPLDAPMHWKFYGNFYAAQAMFQSGGEDWRRWFPPVRDRLLNEQRRDGSWMDDEYGPSYATASALLVLQMPLRYLPIFQR